VATIVGFLGATRLLGDRIVEPAAVAVLAAAVAGARVYRPEWIMLPAVCGGILAGVLTGLMRSQGVPAWVALIAAAAIPAVALILTARNAKFAPAPIVEEGTLLVLALGLATAIGPAIQDGWRSAEALNARPETATGVFPAWVVAAGSASIAIGGLWSAWRHR
jgi:hypothetical protein